MKTLLAAYSLEVNLAADHFRGLPDGSWNGNNGVLISTNGGLSIYDCVNLQLGGSYGLYNWDGRNNLVFGNTKEAQQVGFLTLGASTSCCEWTGGIAYDRMFSHNFGIYSLNPSIDQLRFQLGYSFCYEEVGAWATVNLNTDHETALGIPTSFKTIGQINLFWRHQFENCAQTNLWIGMPYQNSLMFPDERAGNVIIGFAVRAPVVDCLFVDGYTSYMAPRKATGPVQSRNYGFNICLGLTYCFNDNECSYDVPYMNTANHSNFFVDTNVNQ